IYEHGALGYAKGASYSALLSFFPVFAVTTAALFAADASEVARRVANLLYSVSPPEVEQLLQAWFTEHITHPQSLRVAAVLLSLWAASGVVSTLMQAFQAAYEKRDTRGAVHQFAIQIALVLMSMLPAVAGVDSGVCLVRAQLRQLQRAVWLRRSRSGVPGVDVYAGAGGHDRMRIQRGAGSQHGKKVAEHFSRRGQPDPSHRQQTEFT